MARFFCTSYPEHVFHRVGLCLSCVTLRQSPGTHLVKAAPSTCFYNIFRNALKKWTRITNFGQFLLYKQMFEY
ncbi:hypothetical protein SAMN05660706_12233 [Desulfoscipio geothermicus DSM 3669]|uniref:Uncharacterized protein n=1 Tax=Desulfoscipio geothermicus DSM 3669 TaxID=1121426 RepID=A0A1I6DZT4_9FIRM|nr:hypothetical protein SAMN05660706_12233 [Desulfoscipio geothermicus DSM 3669]